MMGLALFGQGITMALIALGLGYIVCDIADRQKETLKSVGFVIGAVIIILGTVILINSLFTGVNLGKRLGGMGMMGNMPQQKMMQPYAPPAGQHNQVPAK
ncbi:MAG: hypothetical protein PHU91_02960 [Candidatus Omnitrophica bacterium]|nr:hypothetical protein [Candidatus Omnitrophota bacterium]MDD5236601.1 hypothetical protein [Candidatus Omnitrophota bacterium]MDD5610442.1 hypothetical protein [Candidatus Omnitrophota bacterium]